MALTKRSMSAHVSADICESRVEPWSGRTTSMHGRVHACVLMVDDVHLRVMSPAASVASRMMQAVARRSVRYIRDTIRRTRTLWKGRQRASLVDSAAGHGAPPLHGTEPSAGWHVGRAGGLRLVEPCVQRPGQHDPLVSSHALCQQVARDPAEKRDVTFHQVPLSVRRVLVCVRERRHAFSHEAGAPGFAIR